MSDVPGIKDLQDALAQEHAAVYLLGMYGARASESKNPALFAQLTTSYSNHRDNRDQLSELVFQAGQTPVAAEVSYQPSAHIDTPEQLRAAAMEIEKKMTVRYGALVAATTGDQRRWAIGALQSAAMRELSYGLAPQDLPGLA